MSNSDHRAIGIPIFLPLRGRKIDPPIILPSKSTMALEVESFNNIRVSNVSVDGKPETVVYTFNPGTTLAGNKKSPKIKKIEHDDDRMELFVMDGQLVKVYDGVPCPYGCTALGNGLFNVSVHV